LALERYAEFDAKRKHSELLEADNANIKRQIDSQAKVFQEEGGFTERLL